MTTAFPGALDAFVNPSAANSMSDALVLHSTQHANLNDAVAALQAKIGVTASAVAGTLTKRIADVEARGSGGGVIRVAASTSIPLDIAGDGKAMPIDPAGIIAVNTPLTPLVGAMVAGGLCTAVYALSDSLNLTNFIVAGDVPTVGFEYYVTYVVRRTGATPWAICSKGPSIVVIVQLPNAATFVPGAITTNSLPFTITAGAVDASHAAAASYKVYFKLSTDLFYTLFANVNTLSGTVTGLTSGPSGTAYNFKVVAMNSGGDAPDSAVVNRTTTSVGTGVLTSSATVFAPSTFDITAAGTIDWGGFAYSGMSLTKLGGGSGLSVSLFGAGTRGPAQPHAPVGTFTDSTQLGAGVAGSTSSVGSTIQPGMYQNLDANPNGATVTVANIGTTQRTVDFYFRSDSNAGSALVTLTLSDGSAVLAPFSVSNTGGANGVRLRTLVKADIASSTLTIRVESSTVQGLAVLVYGLVTVA